MTVQPERRAKTIKRIVKLVFLGERVSTQHGKAFSPQPEQHSQLKTMLSGGTASMSLTNFLHESSARKLCRYSTAIHGNLCIVAKIPMGARMARSSCRWSTSLDEMLYVLTRSP